MYLHVQKLETPKTFLKDNTILCLYGRCDIMSLTDSRQICVSPAYYGNWEFTGRADIRNEPQRNC